MRQFTAPLEIIGVNPYVMVPADILDELFETAGKDKGPIPVQGTINEVAYTQTLVRFAGEWRLYINTKMLKNSPQHVGEIIHVTIVYDDRDRSLPLHPKLHDALEAHPDARRVFYALPPSRQHEINRYICNLKSSAKVDENIQKAINHLNGNVKFVGRAQAS